MTTRFGPNGGPSRATGSREQHRSAGASASATGATSLLTSQDREFLARIAAVNTVLGRVAFPVIEGTLPAEQHTRLGLELVAIGRELLRRAGFENPGGLIIGDVNTRNSTVDPFVIDNE